MRRGIHFDIRHAHERAHVEPLARRLTDRRTETRRAAVVVSPDTRPPVRGAWNVQVFHGLGDKGYTGNPLFLQRGRWPRVRTAANRLLAMVGASGGFLRPPAEPGRRPGRYEQVNAYGPRLHDRLGDILVDVEVSRFGHVALNEREAFRHDPEGPVVWLPTWDNRKYLGGPNQSGLAEFSREVALLSRDVPVRVKYHPLTLVHGQDRGARNELEREPGVEVVGADTDPYRLLDGARGLLTDTSSLGFEAYCMGLPVALACPTQVRHEGLHAELAERVPVMHGGRPDLLAWAEAPPRERDEAWVADLLYPPSRRRNDEFASDLAARADPASDPGA